MADRPRRAGPATAVLLLAILIGLAGCGSDRSATGPTGGAAADVTVADDDGLHGAVLTAPYALGPATLVGSDGEPLALPGDLDHRLTLVFFGYTHCPDICLAVMADIASAFTRLDPDEAEQVGMLLVTSDPARDDPATLRAYLDRFDPRFEGATGPLTRIVALARTVRMPVEHGERLPSGGYAISHGTAVLGVLRDGSVPVLWTEGTSAAKLAEDLRTILADGVPGSDQGEGDG